MQVSPRVIFGSGLYPSSLSLLLTSVSKSLRGPSKMTEIVPTDPFVKEVFAFLNEVRRSGKINMFGAGEVLEKAYGFDRTTANRFVAAWMDNFKSD